MNTEQSQKEGTESQIYTFFVKSNNDPDCSKYDAIMLEGVDRLDAQSKLNVYHRRIIAFRRENCEQCNKDQKEHGQHDDRMC
jgi:hypothetical protein